MSDNVHTPEFRVSFPNVFRPTTPKNAQNAEPKYSMAMLFPKGSDLTKLKEAAKAAIVERFGTDQAKWPKNLKSPFRDQGDFDYEGYEAGASMIRATSKQKPGLVDKNVQPIIEESDFYAGCYARATVRAFYYDQAGNKGVSFGLQNIQKTRDGESLGGRSRPEEEFEAVGGGSVAASGDAGTPAQDPFA